LTLIRVISAIQGDLVILHHLIQSGRACGEFFVEHGGRRHELAAFQDFGHRSARTAAIHGKRRLPWHGDLLGAGAVLRGKNLHSALSGITDM
jgi:hypothetical protein